VAQITEYRKLQNSENKQWLNLNIISVQNMNTKFPSEAKNSLPLNLIIIKTTSKTTKKVFVIDFCINKFDFETS